MGMLKGRLAIFYGMSYNGCYCSDRSEKEIFESLLKTRFPPLPPFPPFPQEGFEMKRLSRIARVSAGRSPGLLLIVMIAVLMALVPGVVHAGGGGGDENNGALATASEECTTDPTFYLVLQPNETRELPVNSFCLNRGKPFPGKQLAPLETASAEIQTAIRYSVEQGYTEKMPELWSVQLAVWNLKDTLTTQDKAHELADEIIAYAREHANDVPECILSPSVPLFDAVQSGLVEASISDLTDVSPPGYDFYGGGTLVVKNLTDQVQVLNIPYGTIFEDQIHVGVQHMAVFPKPGTPPDNPPKPDVPETGGLLAPEILILLAVLSTGVAALVVSKAVWARS